MRARRPPAKTAPGQAACARAKTPGRHRQSRRSAVCRRLRKTNTQPEKGSAAEHLATDARQPVDALAEILRLHRDQDAHLRRELNHRRVPPRRVDEREEIGHAHVRHVEAQTPATRAVDRDHARAQAQRRPRRPNRETSAPPPSARPRRGQSALQRRRSRRPARGPSGRRRAAAPRRPQPPTAAPASARRDASASPATARCARESSRWRSSDSVEVVRHQSVLLAPASRRTNGNRDGQVNSRRLTGRTRPSRRRRTRQPMPCWLSGRRPRGTRRPHQQGTRARRW